jgi:hypothetical protein
MFFYVHKNYQVGSLSVIYLPSRTRIRNSGVRIRGSRRNIFTDPQHCEKQVDYTGLLLKFFANDVPEGGDEEPEVLGLVPHPLPAQAEAGHHQHLQVHAHLHHI